MAISFFSFRPLVVEITKAQIMTVQSITTLQDGDWVLVRQRENTYLDDSRNYTKLTFGDDKYEFVTDKKSPYLVKKRGTIIVPEYVQEDSTVTFWFNLYENYIKSRIGVKGSSLWVLSMPLLAKSENRLIAGKRALHLAWQGGMAPYWVRVYHGETEKPCLSKSGIPSRRIQFEERILSAGHYRVIVSDDKGRIVEETFQVVEGDHIPSLPKQNAQDMNASTMPKWIKKTLHAAWLAQQVGGAWKFEAYQQVAEMSENNQLTLLIKEGLEAGK